MNGRCCASCRLGFVGAALLCWAQIGCRREGAEGETAGCAPLAAACWCAEQQKFGGRRRRKHQRWSQRQEVLRRAGGGVAARTATATSRP